MSNYIGYFVKVSREKNNSFINRQLKLPQIQQIMQEFEKQTEMMNMKEEIMNDVMDDAMEGEDDEDERYKLNCGTVWNAYIFWLGILYLE